MKVHFAGHRQYLNKTLLDAGVRYRLESYYYIVKDDRHAKDELPEWPHFESLIIDSGLFTFMFGSQQGQLTEQVAIDWQKEYAQYVKTTNPQNVFYVEMDVQKILGADFAWELRKRFKRQLGKFHGSRIINVYHLEDGDPKRLIDYSNYIAVSMPELRQNVSPTERIRIASTIAGRAIRKGKRVHLLGLTELPYLRKFRFCTSCDSTGWMESFLYGTAKNTPYGHLSRQQLTDQPNDDRYDYWAALFQLNKYATHAGPQD